MTLPESVNHLHPIALANNFDTHQVRNVTYRIHASGIIERVLPTNPTEEALRDAHYLYTDKHGVVHDFGLIRGHKASRWARKGVLGEGEIYLMEATSISDRANGKFGFRFLASTRRRYLSQAALASLIGALMEVGYDDIASTGFSEINGSPGVSVSHINGENGDFRFLRLDKDWTQPTHINLAAGVSALDEARQRAFNEALFRFGWKDLIAWEYTKNGSKHLLPRTRHLKNHHHHLHVGGYRPSIRPETQ